MKPTTARLLTRALYDVFWLMLFLLFVIPGAEALQKIYGIEEFLSLLISIITVRFLVLLIEMRKEIWVGLERESADARD
jgi:hypothetical protein